MKIIIRTIICLLMTILLPAHFVYANLPKNITTAFPSAKITSTGIVLNAPDIAENGAVVNISIKQISLHKENLHVREIWLFDQFRESPIAHYKLGPYALAEGISSRYKLIRSSVVYAIALLSDGSMISGSKLIKVTIGGCGGASTIVGHYDASPAYNLTPTYANRSSVNLSAIRQSASSAFNAEKYAHIESNGIIQAATEPVSTFSVDVDTGSYSNIRRFLLRQGQLPVTDAVRLEEMINYFSYDYPQPDNLETPFTITTEVGPSPWKYGTHLLQIGVQGYQENRHELPAANLVFLIDVSGSMRSHDKLGLIKSSLRMLTRQLGEQDRIAIVVYAGASGVTLDTTRADDTNRIANALNSLTAGGSTNGGAGIQLAYAMAQKSFIKNGINRVILATDGDFNVGTVNHQALIDLIKKQRKSGITLTTLGFGAGNYNEKMMEQLADHGDGNYAYIDTLHEARKVLVTQLASTLFTIAKDTKIQVEFNPAVVAEYRLIGYENRLLRKEDFKNDKVDAGDVGAGHSVTALYEITFVDSKVKSIEPLRYSDVKKTESHQSEIAFVRMRFKGPKGGISRELKHPVYRIKVQDDINRSSDNFRFAAAVAAFGQLLRHSPHVQTMNYNQVHQLAKQSLGDDEKGYRKEFLDLIDTANSL